MAKKKAQQSSKKILITGGTGFLGTHVVRNLIETGEKGIRVIASHVPEWMKDEGVESIEGSILDAKDLGAALKDVSVVIHLAGKVSRDNDDATLMNKVHLEGTRLLCDAAVESGAATLVLASSSGTIAVSEDPFVHDEHSPQPVELLTRWAYYASKYYQERTALHGFQGEGKKLVVLNPSLLLGPGDDRMSSTKIVLDLLAKRVPYSPGGGLNFVDARDAAPVFLSAIEKGANGEKYLLGAANMPFAEFFGRVERLSGVSAPLINVPKKLAVAGSSIVESFFANWGKTSPVATSEVEQAECFWYFESSKAMEELGFDPRDPQQTLNDTIKYIRSNTLGEDVF